MLDLFIALLMGLFSGNAQPAATNLQSTTIEQQTYNNPPGAGENIDGDTGGDNGHTPPRK